MSALRRAVRSRFGLWPVHELRNRVVMAHRLPALRRVEDAEVARLAAPSTPSAPVAEVVTVVPTFRRPGMLVEAVRSALAQTVDDHRVIVVDDGGGLPELPADPRLTAVSLSRNTAVLGLVRNVGVRLTRSRFVAFLDDDNTWAPDHLEHALAALHGGADLVYTAVERRRPDGTLVDVLGRPWDRRAFRDGTPFVDVNAVVVRRDDRVRFSRLPRVKATLPKEDWEFVHRLSGSREVRHVPEPTVRYLVNDGSYYTSWTS